MAANRQKLKALIAYIVARMCDAEKFGSTKLNKVLFRAESLAYIRLGEPITGYIYQKNTHGPTLRAFLHIVKEMEGEGLLEVVPGLKRFDETRYRLTGKVNLAFLSAAEVEATDDALVELWHDSAGEASDASHWTAAFRATRPGAAIEWPLCLVEDPGTMIPLSHAEEERVVAAFRRHQARTSTGNSQPRV